MDKTEFTEDDFELLSSGMMVSVYQCHHCGEIFQLELDNDIEPMAVHPQCPVNGVRIIKTDNE